MEYFYSYDSYAPTAPQYFSPTGMFCFRLTILLMAALSALMHAVFILSIKKLCGTGARSAYLVLGAIALTGLGYSFNAFGSFSLALFGLKWNDCVIVWRTFGGVFISTILIMSFLHFYLLLQRIICVFFPMKVELILRRAVVLICSFIAFLFYFAVVAICLTPYVGLAYIPEHSSFIPLIKLPNSIMLVSANNFANYAAVLSNVIAYPVLLLVLRLKLKSSLNSKEEMRLTTQAALSVGIEVIFFLMFEFISVEGATQIVFYATVNLWYYNAVTLPYLCMNKRVREEMKRLFTFRKPSVKVTLVKASIK